MALSPSKLKKNAVTSAKVKDGSLKAGDFAAGQIPKGPQGIQGEKGDPGAPATALWAHVNSAGTLALFSNASESKLVETGVYEVDFNRDVTKCAYGGSMSAFAGEIEVERQGERDQAIRVETFNSSGTPASQTFTVAAFC